MMLHLSSAPLILTAKLKFSALYGLLLITVILKSLVLIFYTFLASCAFHNTLV